MLRVFPVIGDEGKGSLIFMGFLVFLRFPRYFKGGGGPHFATRFLATTLSLAIASNRKVGAGLRLIATACDCLWVLPCVC